MTFIVTTENVTAESVTVGRGAQFLNRHKKQQQYIRGINYRYPHPLCEILEKTRGVSVKNFFLRKTLRKFFRRFAPDEKQGGSICKGGVYLVNTPDSVD